MLSLGGGRRLSNTLSQLGLPTFLGLLDFFNDKTTPQKSNIKNDGLENVPPWKHGYFGYLC